MSNFHELARENIKQLPYPGPMAHNKTANIVKNKCVFLDSNTNAFGGAFKYYPDILQEKLKQQYLNFLWELDLRTKEQSGLANPLTAANILFSTGAVDALDLVFKAFAEPQLDQVILTPPTFSAFSHWSHLYRLQLINLPLKENGSGLAVAEILASKAKLLLLCDPNNPLGTRINSVDIMDIINNFSQLIIIDEAYVEFSKSSSALSMIDKNPNLIILRTCSKALGMAGLRIGAVIANEQIINTLKRVQPPFNMPSPVEDIFRQQLTNPSTIYNGIEQIRNERARVLSALRHSTLIKKIFPSDTNFLCIEFNDLPKVIDLFSAANIQVIWRPEDIPNTARITLGANLENNLLINTLNFAK